MVLNVSLKHLQHIGGGLRCPGIEPVFHNINGRRCPAEIYFVLAVRSVEILSLRMPLSLWVSISDSIVMTFWSDGKFG